MLLAKKASYLGSVCCARASQKIFGVHCKIGGQAKVTSAPWLNFRLISSYEIL